MSRGTKVNPVKASIYNCPGIKPVYTLEKAESNGRQQNRHQRRYVCRFSESSRRLVVGTTSSRSRGCATETALLTGRNEDGRQATLDGSRKSALVVSRVGGARNDINKLGRGADSGVRDNERRSRRVSSPVGHDADEGILPNDQVVVILTDDGCLIVVKRRRGVGGGATDAVHRREECVHILLSLVTGKPERLDESSKG